MAKPILIRTGGLTNRIWAVRRYRERPNGMVVSDAKDDVTAEAIAAVVEHAKGCGEFGCMCSPLREVARRSYQTVSLVDPA